MLRHTPLSVVYAMAWYDTSGGLWTKMGLRSFREHFPNEELIVVHNNQKYATNEMRAVVSEHASQIAERIITKSSAWTSWNPHGRAIDLVVEICRRNNYDILILIEPDCLFKGRVWSDNLIDALATHKLAGINRVQYGPIHPGISAWNVNAIPMSFNATVRRSTDPVDEKFNRNLDTWLKEDYNNNEEAIYHIKWWDTGLLNSAIVDDEACIIANPDVVHFGGAYARTPYYYKNHPDFSLIKNYIE